MARPVSNPPNPWNATEVEWLGAPPEIAVEVFEEDASSLLSRNESPDVPFEWSVNPYRGCAHACSYCYARTSHQYLGFGAGTDFDSRLVVKRNAPQVLAAELARRSWRGQPICFSGNTDCYQPLEASYELTRRCLEVCLAAGNPVGVITKGALVRRDADLLAALARVADVHVTISIPFASEDKGRRVEPGAPSPAQRFQSIEALAQAGVPTGVAIAPLIPGLNEDEVPGILERAAQAGATHAFCSLLRLPGQVAEVFTERLRASFPERSSRVLSALRDFRGGALNEGAFGKRMQGQGERWRVVQKLFEVTCRRVGLQWTPDAEGPRMPRARRSPRQGSLFDEP